MSSKLIKKYKYIDKGTTKIIGNEKVLKNIAYVPANYPQFYEADSNFQPQPEKQSQAPVTNDITSPKSAPAKKSENSVDPDPQSNDSTESSPDISSILEDQKKAIEEQLKSQYEARLNSEKQVSYNDGMQNGKKAGLAENDAEIDNLKKLFNNIQSEFQSAASNFFDEVEKLTMDMSVHLAKKIIGDAVAVVPEIIRTNVDKCVKLLAGAGTVQIKINPNDYDTVKSYIPALEHQSEDKFTFVLEPDNKIERGGCIVEFEGSSIDGRIETQIEKIQSQMEMIT